LTRKTSRAERRSHRRRAIRLNVVYRSARSLVTEYTTSVSRGGCRLQCKQAIAVGTNFVFQMLANKSTLPVEIVGEVMWCRPATEPGLFDVGVKYVPSEDKRAALESVLEQIFQEHDKEPTRLHVRVPVNLVAQDTVTPTRRYLVRDISHGGIGLRLPMDLDLPDDLVPRTLVNFAVKLGQSVVEIGGEVVWTLKRRPGFTHAAIGVAFVGAGPAQHEIIDALVHLSRPAELFLTLVPRNAGGTTPA
jgi:hypothetical protein